MTETSQFAAQLYIVGSRSNLDRFRPNVEVSMKFSDHFVHSDFSGVQPADASVERVGEGLAAGPNPAFRGATGDAQWTFRDLFDEA